MTDISHILSKKIMLAMKKNKYNRICSFLVIFCSITLISFVSYAGDTGIKGFNALNYRPNVDGLGFLNVDTADVLMPGLLSSNATFQYARRSLSFTDPALNNLTTDLAENQVLANFVLGFGLLEFLDVGMDIPVLIMQNGTRCINATCTNISNYTGSALGDIRYLLKLKVLDEKKYFISLALASDIGIPTGNRKLFTGGKNVSYEQKVILSKQTKYVDLAVNLGYRVVDSVETIGTKYDDHMTFGVGAKGKLPHKMFVEGTIAGNIYFENNGDDSTPVEFLASVGRDFKNDISCSVGVGTRLNDGIGAADFRIMGGCGIKFPLTEKAKKMIEAREKGVSYDEMIAGVTWTIPLKTDQCRLDGAQNEILDDVIRYLNADQSRKIMIIGNADDRSSYDYNMELATKRAIAVRDYLVGHGVNPKQIVLGTYGEAIPNAQGKDMSSRESNRSIVIKEVL